MNDLRVEIEPRGGTGHVDVAAERMFDLLADDDCRCLVTAASSPVTATELGTHCSLPTSTLYRKLDALVDAGLLRETEQTPTGGNPARTYERTIDALRVSLAQESLRPITHMD